MPRLTVRLSEELHKKLQVKANSQGVSASDAIREAVSLWSDNRQQNGAVPSDNGHNEFRDIFDLLRSELSDKGRQLEEKDKQLDEKDKQISELHQLLGMKEKNVGALTDQLDTQRAMIEDMRRPWWRRVLKR